MLTLNSVFIFAFVFSILYLIREGFEFFKALREEKGNMTTPRLWGIGLALSYFITFIISLF